MEKQYIAFISYSRKDKDIAEWLHKKLESYKLPDEERIREIFPFEGKYFRPVFLDTLDLHVEERPFNDRIKVALQNTSYLIVLCSRNSAASPFVDKEIRYFLKSHENNVTRIVPIFIDEVNGSIPEAFDRTSIMQRHFPIYNSRLSGNSEANNYCFYQIISYILGINFSNIYNRYEIQTLKQQKSRQKKIIATIISLLLLLSVAIGYGYYLHLKNNEIQEKTAEIIERKQRQIEFERTVFPAAVVDGYEKNFLTPVIKHLKKTPEKFSIYILMPENEKDLTHDDRVGDFEYNGRVEKIFDSLSVEQLETDTKRGSRIMRPIIDNHPMGNIYLDFATTTSSFLTVANYKKRAKEYRKMPKDSMIREYSTEFIKQVNQRLGRDSVYVRFFTDREKMLQELKTHNKRLN